MLVVDATRVGNTKERHRTTKINRKLAVVMIALVVNVCGQCTEIGDKFETRCVCVCVCAFVCVCEWMGKGSSHTPGEELFNRNAKK